MKKYSPGKVLVTGSSGLIGNAITKCASSKEFKVLAHSRRTTSVWKHIANVDSIYFDLKNKEEVLFDNDVDTVIHTATSNENKLSSINSALENTLLGTYNLLNRCVVQGVKKFVYVSTVQLYSKQEGTISESSEVNFSSIYTKQHYLVEQLLRVYASEFNEGVNILRVANVFSDSVYALSQRYNLVPTCFVKDGVSTGKIVLKTNGEQKRNFINDQTVGEIAIKTLFDSISNFKVINVATMYTPSIIEIAEMVKQEFQSQGINLDIIRGTEDGFKSHEQNFETQFYEKSSVAEQKILMTKSIRELIKNAAGHSK